VSVLPNDYLRERLAFLATLEDGWYCPHTAEGKSLDPVYLEAVGAVLETETAAGMPMPSLCPTTDGRIVAEWTVGPWEASVTIDADLAGEADAVDVVTGRERDTTIDLRQPGLLRAWLAALNGGTP
jgi:hypothetical protein